MKSQTKQYLANRRRLLKDSYVSEVKREIAMEYGDDLRQISSNTLKGVYTELFRKQKFIKSPDLTPTRFESFFRASPESTKQEILAFASKKFPLQELGVVSQGTKTTFRIKNPGNVIIGTASKGSKLSIQATDINNTDISFKSIVPSHGHWFSKKFMEKISKGEMRRVDSELKMLKASRTKFEEMTMSRIKLLKDELTKMKKISSSDGSNLDSSSDSRNTIGRGHRRYEKKYLLKEEERKIKIKKLEYRHSGHYNPQYISYEDYFKKYSHYRTGKNAGMMKSKEYLARLPQKWEEGYKVWKAGMLKDYKKYMHQFNLKEYVKEKVLRMMGKDPVKTLFDKMKNDIEYAYIKEQARNNFFMEIEVENYDQALDICRQIDDTARWNDFHQAYDDGLIKKDGEWNESVDEWGREKLEEQNRIHNIKEDEDILARGFNLEMKYMSKKDWLSKTHYDEDLGMVVTINGKTEPNVRRPYEILTANDPYTISQKKTRYYVGKHKKWMQSIKKSNIKHARRKITDAAERVRRAEAKAKRNARWKRKK